VSFGVVFRVFLGRVKPDLVLFEEGIQFVAGCKAQKVLELGRGELAFPISLESNGFESGAGEVLAGGSQGSEKLVGEIEDELHGGSIAGKREECT
jgi:hypothetical protein